VFPSEWPRDVHNSGTALRCTCGHLAPPGQQNNLCRPRVQFPAFSASAAFCRLLCPLLVVCLDLRARARAAGTVGRVADETDAWESGNLAIWGRAHAIRLLASRPGTAASHGYQVGADQRRAYTGSSARPPSLSCCLLLAPRPLPAWILPSSAASWRVAMQARQVRAVGCSSLHDGKKHCLHRSVLPGSSAASFRPHFTASRRHIHLFLDSSWRCGPTANPQSQHTLLADPAAYETLKKSTTWWIIHSHGRWVSCGPTATIRRCAESGHQICEYRHALS
jgi:hypothetical protein